MKRNPLLALLAAVLGFASGCGGDKSVDDGDAGDSGDSGDAGDSGNSGSTDCTGDDSCPDWQICESGECIDGDRNDSSDDAESILWEDVFTGYINPAGDVDYYTFSAEGGEMIKLSVTTEYEDGDTVMVLRKPNGKVVSMADEFATETSVTDVDSVVFAYLSKAGDYVLSIEDDGTWYSGGDPVGDPDYAYTIALEEWNQPAPEPDSFDDPGFTSSLAGERLWSSIGVLLETEGDKDYVALDFDIDGANIYLDGDQSMDGSDAVARVRLLTPDGTVLTDKSDVGPSHYALYPAAAAGSYVVELSDESGGGGDDYWLFLHIIARYDDPAFDQESESNDDVAMADELQQTTYENGSGLEYDRALGMGVLDAADDDDWFSFEAPYDENYVVVCMNSSLWGSGVAPGLELADLAGTVLDSGAGSSTSSPNARIENAVVEPGSYYLRVVPPDDAVGGPGDWYRFSLYVASFNVASYEDGGYACP